MSDHWIAERTRCFDTSGIRRVFELGAKLTVFRNDEVTIRKIKKLKPSGIIISPGPGTP